MVTRYHLGLYLIYNKTLIENPRIPSETDRVPLLKEYNYNYCQALI
jgi:hypothetical protein